MVRASAPKSAPIRKSEIWLGIYDLPSTRSGRRGEKPRPASEQSHVPVVWNIPRAASAVGPRPEPKVLAASNYVAVTSSYSHISLILSSQPNPNPVRRCRDEGDAVPKAPTRSASDNTRCLKDAALHTLSLTLRQLLTV